jgi:hypothetical protein
MTENEEKEKRQAMRFLILIGLLLGILSFFIGRYLAQL